MIDPALLRDHPDVLRQSQAARGDSVEAVDVALAADIARRAAIGEYDELRAAQNVLSKKVATATPEERAELVREAQELGARVKSAQHHATEATEEFNSAVARISNVVHHEVPVGGEDDFVVLRHRGDVPVFSFDAKDHLELGESLGLIDMARGAKVSGSRFPFLRGVGARLDIALMNLGLDRALANGFVPVIPPTLVRPEVMRGTGFLGQHADEVYYLPADELYLTGTSEVALAGYHADEIIDLSAGPLRYAGWSSCYRREAGSHGKDTRGIMRVHQFNKLEMFSYVAPAEAESEHERLLALQEEMLTALGLTYRVIDVATGDLGQSAARKFDVEAWIPTQNAYRELTSTSNCMTFQSRRLGIRFRDSDGKPAPAATVNGTLATTRWLVAILETHQQADGTVLIPEPLRPYLGGLEFITSDAGGR